MTNTFRAPVTFFQSCNEDTIAAIEALINLSPAKLCLRLDFLSANNTLENLTRDGLTLFMLNDDNTASYLALHELEGELRTAYLEALGYINDDLCISDNLSSHFSPPNFMRESFRRNMERRHLSLLFLGGGLGAVMQEYIPSWFEMNDEQEYFHEDARPELRAEIMSIFCDPDLSNHQLLSLQSHANACHPMLAAMFEYHSDGEDYATLASIDFSDRLKHQVFP